MAGAQGERPEGRYANYFEIGQNASEVVIDFGQSYEDRAGARVHTRIITSPVYAMALLRTLTEALERHRRMYGAAGDTGER